MGHFSGSLSEGMHTAWRWDGNAVAEVESSPGFPAHRSSHRREVHRWLDGSDLYSPLCGPTALMLVAVSVTLTSPSIGLAG